MVTANRNRVIVITAQTADRMNITDLENFGELTFLFDRDDRMPSALHLSSCAEVLAARLHEIEYDSRTDLVAIAGKQIYLCALCYVLGMDYVNCKFLVYDSAEERYVQKEIVDEKIPRFDASSLPPSHGVV